MADDKETVNHAVAGDIIGLYDTGNYQIGDTIGGRQSKIQFPRLTTIYT
jgi:peptide chain release factor 3